MLRKDDLQKRNKMSQESKSIQPEIVKDEKISDTPMHAGRSGKYNSPSEKLERKADEILKKVRQLCKDSHDLESEEIVGEIENLSNTLSSVHTSAMTLTNKFKVGKVICENFMKQELFRYMCEFCVRQRKALPNVGDTEVKIWSLFSLCAMFSCEFCEAVVSFDGFLFYGKEALEKLLSLFAADETEMNQEFLVFAVTAVTHNICTFCEETVSRVKDLGYLPVYQKYLNCNKLLEDVIHRIVFIAGAADIMDEKDGPLTGSREEIEIMLVSIEEGIQCHSGQFNGWFPFELGKVLGQLAVFDNNKKQLVEYGALGPVTKLAKQNEEIDQLTAIKTLAHLAFDEDNRKSMLEDQDGEVVQTLFDLAKSGSYTNVREAARGVLWTISELLHTSKKYAEQADDLFAKKTKGHIMISYSREQRPLLLKIKNEITKAGFKVWMDIEQMRDNVYDRMAEAVQGASVVLLSMSRSYQRSEYCRREAAYASSLKRNRVPLLVDPGYTADGWLAIMTAGDYHYDFVNKPFEQKIGELLSEIKLRSFSEKEIGNSVQEPNSDVYPAHSSPLYSSPGVMTQQQRVQNFGNFKEKDISKWLEKHKLPRDIFGGYRATDMVFLVNMKEQAPECYYKQIMKITRKGSENLSALQVAADFSKALEDLTI